jgi:hypothetical protein
MRRLTQSSPSTPGWLRSDSTAGGRRIKLTRNSRQLRGRFVFISGHCRWLWAPPSPRRGGGLGRGGSAQTRSEFPKFPLTLPSPSPGGGKNSHNMRNLLGKAGRARQGPGRREEPPRNEPGFRADRLPLHSAVFFTGENVGGALRRADVSRFGSARREAFPLPSRLCDLCVKFPFLPAKRQ